MNSSDDDGYRPDQGAPCPKIGRELLEMFLELSGVDNAEVRQWFKDWMLEFEIDEDKLSTEDLRVLATCFLERMSAELIHNAEDTEDYFMLPQA